MSKFFSKKYGVFSFAVLTFACLFIASMFLKNFGSTQIINATTKNAAGNTISMRIFKPKEASAQNKAPAIILMHGLSTTKECYAQYGIELAKKGFVVITPDMLNHGDSEIADMKTFFQDPRAEGYGMYAAVRYAASLDYVNVSKIGAVGHSMGGNATNMSVFGDNLNPNPLISSVYLISSSPMTNNLDGSLFNLYGSRDAGIYYTFHDHVYFLRKINISNS